MAHPTTDPRTDDSTKADIASIVIRYAGDPRKVLAVLQLRATIVNMIEDTPQSITDLYEAAVNEWEEKLS